MSQPVAHLHLVSEQTIPNLLAILALKPERVLLLRSADPRFADVPRHLQQAAVLAGVPAATFAADDDLRIPESPPSIGAVRQRITALAARYDIGLIHITGGTKLMSIGARDFARAAGIPTLYVDKDWFSGETGELPELPPLRELARRLTVRQVLCAYGLDASALKMDAPVERQLDFGRAVLDLMTHAPAPTQRYLGKVRDRLRPDRKDPRKSEIDGILARGLPAPDDDTQHAFLQAAAARGVVEEHGAGNWRLVLPGATRTPDDRVRATLRCLQELEGSWYEYACAHAMLTSGRFADIHIGVESQRRDDSLGETDIVAVDPERLALAFVSCKVSDTHVKPLEHVFATRQRAVEFGGAFSHTMFCVHRFDDHGKRTTFEAACRTLRCGLLVGAPDFSASGPQP